MGVDGQPGGNGSNGKRYTAEGKLLGGATGKGFMPGVSGNPKGGQPGHPCFQRAYEAVCKEMGVDPDTLLVKLAIKVGGKRGGSALVHLFDRRFGPLTQRLEVEAQVKVYTDPVMDLV